MLNQDNDGYKVLIEYQPDAFAYQQIVLDDRGNLHCIIVSGTIDERLGAKLIENGAIDYIEKWDLKMLPPVVERVLL